MLLQKKVDSNLITDRAYARIMDTLRIIEKSYLSTKNISKKWDQAYRNWGPILSELSIMFDGRIQTIISFLLIDFIITFKYSKD